MTVAHGQESLRKTVHELAGENYQFAHAAHFVGNAKNREIEIAGDTSGCDFFRHMVRRFFALPN
jgi:hypothetical protein